MVNHGLAKLFYIDFGEYGKGANLGCSVILQALLQHAQLRGYLPRRLRVQSDNTSADYKNSVTFRFLGNLVSEGIFDEVKIFCDVYARSFPRKVISCLQANDLELLLELVLSGTVAVNVV